MTAETVVYSCGSCEAKERALQVAAREPDTLVRHWLRDVVAPAVNRDHAEFHCPSEIFDLKINTRS